MMMKTYIAVSWVTSSCSVVGGYRGFGETHLPSSLLRPCEMLVTKYQITRCHKVEGYNESRYNFSLDNLFLLA
jgi:hypothetical protein